MLAEQATIKNQGLSGVTINDSELQDYLKDITAKGVDDEQVKERIDKQTILSQQRHRVRPCQVKFKSVEEPNGNVYQYKPQERRRFQMLKEMKQQKLPEIKGASISKRMHVLETMLKYDEYAAPYLKSVKSKYAQVPMCTQGVSEYIIAKVAKKHNLDPKSFAQANISNMVTTITRAFEFAGLVKRELDEEAKGRRFFYYWAVDLARHGITKEQLEWAYVSITHNDEYKKLLAQSRIVRKPAKTLDDMPEESKVIFQKLLDENETLRKQVAAMQSNGGDNGGNGGAPIDEDRDAVGNLMMAHSKPGTQKPPKRSRHFPTVDCKDNNDPFGALDNVKGQLTRGSQIEIKITL